MLKFFAGFAVGVLVCLGVLFFNIIANYDPGSQGYVQPRSTAVVRTTSGGMRKQMQRVVNSNHNLMIPEGRIKYIEAVKSIQPSYKDKQLYPNANRALITVKLQCREIEDVSKCVDLALNVILQLNAEME